ncbi:N-acetyltransferase [Salinimicrobium marinum]|uniref:N-acetyltransferase n=1 Tax=Salinimicrobium marinum TaxID=680283 RepID=A0A918VX40_9FLAO|nr:GNAT family N-acetyltransferase [Salinimicrobium marinum]GHA31444.1 N-acetyltransferase [Salinimicrobium marinum]
MSDKFSLRLVTEQDVHEVLDIYKPYVQNTIVSFEYDVPTIEEYLQRIKTNTVDYPWLVGLRNKEIIGYAYAGRHRNRTAYQWSPESTIYLSPEVHGKGVARILYDTLFRLLRLQGYCNVYAGIGLPNDRSTRFHRALGFEEIGIFKKVGYKHGNWHDTQWFQLQLNEPVLEPPTPKKLDEVRNSEEFKSVITTANKKLAAI